MMEVEMYVESKLKDLDDPERDRRASALLSLRQQSPPGRGLVPTVGRRLVAVGSWIEQVGYRMSPLPEASE